MKRERLSANRQKNEVNPSMKTIHAIYENGVFKPTEPVNLPEHCNVRVEPETLAAFLAQPPKEDPITEALNRVYGEGRESSELDPRLLRAQALTLKRNPD